MSTGIDVVFRVLAVLLWVVLILAAARRVTGLRTAAWVGAIAAAVTLRIGAVAAAADLLTGRLAWSVLVSNLLLVAALTMLVADHLRRRRGAEPRWLYLVAGLGTGAMTVGWVLGSLPGPATVAPQGLPAQLFTRTPIALSVLVFGALLVLLAVTFVRAVGRELADLAPGSLRRDLTAAAVLTGGVATWASAVGIVAVAGLVRGPVPELAPLLLDAVLAALLALGVALAVRPVLRGHGEDPQQLRDEVLQLHRWLIENTSPTGRVGVDPDDLFVAVVEIRDRMWILQRWVSPAEVDAALRLGRRLGLSGPATRAFAVAVCLEIAVAGAAAGDDQELDVADLSALGGAATEDQEVAWLALVQRARTRHRAAAAAAAILDATPAGTSAR
ncbi:MAG: DUF6545 domain-containing protein [Gemmatimonadales bacterium]